MADPVQLAFFALIFLTAGTVKGAAGMGLPTTAISLMTLTVDPRTAIALVLVPMMVSNAWQVHRSGQVLRAFRTYLPLSLALMIGVAITVTIARNAPDRALLATLGGVLLIFVAVNATRWAPAIPAAHDRPVQIATGSIAGIMGGITSVWAPPMAVYLAARGVGKDEFVRASGLLIFLGSIPLAHGYARQGFLTAELAVTSLALLVPTFAGFTLGEAIRGRLSERGFRRVLLVLFALMGANLIRRALF